MSATLANAIRQTTITTGTDPLVLGAAAARHLTAAQVFGTTPCQLFYRLDWGTADWEIGFGQLLSDGTFARYNVFASSAAGANVYGWTTYVSSLPAGEKTFTVIATAANLVAVKPGDGYPILSPSVSDQDGTAVGVGAFAGAPGATAIGHGARALAENAIMLGKGNGVHRASISHQAVESSLTMHSVNQIVGKQLSMYGGTVSLNVCSVGSGEVFSGHIDLQVRGQSPSSGFFHQRIDLSASSTTIVKTQTTISNTLSPAPTLAIAMDTWDAESAGRRSIKIDITNPGASTLYAAARSAGILTLY